MHALIQTVCGHRHALGSSAPCSPALSAGGGVEGGQGHCRVQARVMPETWQRHGSWHRAGTSGGWGRVCGQRAEPATRTHPSPSPSHWVACEIPEGPTGRAQALSSRGLWVCEQWGMLGVGVGPSLRRQGAREHQLAGVWWPDLQD